MPMRLARDQGPPPLPSSAVRRPSSPPRASPVMKKPPKPFTFEVKRSRLSSPKASTFQRYLAAPEAARRTPDASGLQVAIRVEPPPPPSPVRILPSLLSERAWREEPEVPAVTPDGEDAPDIVDKEAAVETRLAASDIIASAGDLLPAEPEEPNRSRLVRHRAKSPDDLPRSERWKRRLPRSAW
jgi:hypothetical protein